MNRNKIEKIINEYFGENFLFKFWNEPARNLTCYREKNFLTLELSYFFYIGEPVSFQFRMKKIHDEGLFREDVKNIVKFAEKNMIVPDFELNYAKYINNPLPNWSMHGEYFFLNEKKIKVKFQEKNENLSYKLYVNGKEQKAFVEDLGVLGNIFPDNKIKILKFIEKYYDAAIQVQGTYKEHLVANVKRGLSNCKRIKIIGKNLFYDSMLLSQTDDFDCQVSISEFLIENEKRKEKGYFIENFEELFGYPYFEEAPI